MNAHEALLEFLRWAMREGPWDGGDLDGASIQDKAEALGLIIKTQYDAEKHGVQSDFEDGDDWFEYAPHIRGVAQGQQEPEPCPYAIDGCVLENQEIGPCLCALTSADGSVTPSHRVPTENTSERQS